MNCAKIAKLIFASAFTLKLFALCPDPDDHENYKKTETHRTPTRPAYTPPKTPPPVKCHDEPEPVCPPMEVLCDAGPRVCYGSDVYFTGTFILWAPHQEGTEYAISGLGTNPAKGDVHDVDYGVEPGFKVGLGYDLPHDGWDMYAEFTWLRPCADDRTTSANNSSLFTTLNNNPLQEASADWNMKFNVIDGEIGRNFFLSKHLKYRPFIGFKGTWQDQDYDVIYTSNNPLFGTRVVRIDQDYWGFGLRTGVDTAWHFTNNWSIFGNMAISALWSGYDIDRRDIQQFIGQEDTDINTNNSYHTIVPVLELMIGLRWETWFYHNEYRIALDAGWEEQVWWGYNRYVVINQPQQNGGDLTFQGLTFTVRFDF